MFIVAVIEGRCQHRDHQNEDQNQDGRDDRKKRFSLAGLIRDFSGELARRCRLSSHHWKVLNTLKECRGGKLGTVVMYCEECGEDYDFNLSCGDRHCPRCSGARVEQWREAQSEALLPVPYYHLVFTLPHVLNALIRDNRKELYGLLFEKAVEVLQQFAEQEYGGKLGITAVLHTWGQTLCEHYHLHLLIPGGVWVEGEGEDGGEAGGRWRAGRASCLVPVRPVAECFRGAFLKGVEELYEAGGLSFHSEESRQRREAGAFRNWLQVAARPKWNVFSEKSRVGPAGAVNYLARYSHRVALSEGRVREVSPGQAGSPAGQETGERAFELSYVDNRDGKAKKLVLSGVELLRRFAWHILPRGFVRVRHFGFLSAGTRARRLERIRGSIQAQGLAVMPAPAGKAGAVARSGNQGRVICPGCRRAPLRWLMTLVREGKPGPEELPLIWDTS